MEELTLQIQELIAEKWGLEKEQVKPESHFFDDFNADQAMMADLFGAVQEKYKIIFSSEEISELLTVEDLTKLVADKSDEFI